MRVIDPAQAYLDEHRLDGGPGHQPVHRGAVVFGPGVPGGSRPATDAERAALAEEAARSRTDREADLADVEQRWGPELHRAADELLATGAAELVLGDRTVHARLVRFWRGDDVLETTTQAPRSDGRSLTRISRDPRRGGRAVLAAHLADAAV
ncbi:hypothetical protein GCM10027451_47400 [Geodermatophilus aquaeductus]|uniref:Uncharacterized protein n=2 Tax=Geodermatophilus aquaeductus TaxID=1564161 RepID=A0A521FS31_9ACTN|nr:hypothetical protein SAMN06273567_1152 [Geodermatophilus aquaeductus]